MPAQIGSYFSPQSVSHFFTTFLSKPTTMLIKQTATIKQIIFFFVNNYLAVKKKFFLQILIKNSIKAVWKSNKMFPINWINIEFGIFFFNCENKQI